MSLAVFKANARVSTSSCFVIDIGQLATNERLTLTGYVVTVRKLKNRGLSYIRVRDLTGSILAAIPIEIGDPPPKGSRVKLTCVTADNDSGERLLRVVEEVNILGRLGTQLDSLEGEMSEYATRMLMSRVCRYASEFLSSRDFVEFDSRVISTQWATDGLEPLLVVYPGFGGPVALATSPASQVLDFMIVTGLSRAFTVSKSFTTTYRFANGGTEERVLVARASDLAQEELATLAQELTDHILLQLGPADPRDQGSKEPGAEFVVTTRQAELRECADSWSTGMTPLVQVQNARGGPLVEGSLEQIGARLRVANLVLYPAQFLEAIKRTPTRQLRDLASFRSWLAT